MQLPPGARMVVVYGDEIDPLTGRRVVVDAYWEVCVPKWVSTGPDGDVVCTTYPDEPGQPATPARWEMSAWLEWNSGANSVPEQAGDCEVTFPMGAVIGEVVGLDLGAAQDRLLVRLSDGTRAEIPFVEAIVPTVDQDAGRVVIDAPPGLLDLARE